MPWFQSCAALALFASACAAPPAVDGGAYVGVREWIGPFGDGHLDLRRDLSFRLTVKNGSGGKQEIVGDWQPAGDGVVLRVHDAPGDGTSPFAGGTAIDALICGDYATYLGANGVVDLWWGY